MKLCFLAGANSVHSNRWIKYFADNSYEVYWISLVAPIDADIKNIKLCFIKELVPGRLSPLNLLFSAIRVKRLIKKINPDILHAHYAGVNGVVGAFSGFHPFILTAWGSDVLIAAKSKIKRPLVKFAFNKADLITCDAEHMRIEIMKLGVPDSKIKIIYFGVDTQKFSPEKKSEKLRNELKIVNSTTIISLRNLEPIYDIESLIRSIPYVAKEIPKARFLIMGRGSQERKLKRLAKSLRVLDNITFLGWVSNDELPLYLTSADIYVSTSLSDAGLAASTAEAMACGLPVVITDSGENRKWITDGDGGFIIPLKDPKTLAERVIYLLKHKDIRRQFGILNRKIIKERNDYYKEMDKMENVYKELIEKTYDGRIKSNFIRSL